MKRRISKIILLTILMSLLIGGTSLAQGVSPRGTLEGYITSIDETWIVIETYSGSRIHLLHHKDIKFFIDDIPVDLADFKPGMEIYAKYRDFSVYHLEGYSTQNPGFISPAGKMRSGTVKAIDRDQIIVNLTGGGEESFFLSPATLILKQGKLVTPSTLYVGDMVRLYFDEMDTSIISRMHIQGYSEKIRALYRGTLDGADGVESSLILKDVEVFREGKWEKHKDILKIDYSTDSPIYLGGAPVPQNNLKYLRGKTAYAAVKGYFGGEKIEKLVLKNQYEAHYSEKIAHIHWYSDTLELGNRRNLQINDGTIFIKGERLVDKGSVNPGADAHIIADGGVLGASANIVYIYSDDMNNSPLGQHYLYAGKLGMVLENYLNLQDFYILNQHQWESFREDKELYYDDDTYIYNMDEGRQITPEEFYSGDYAIDREGSRRGRPRSWYGYTFTDADRAIAISLMEDMDSLLRQRITLGIVDRVEEDIHMGKTLHLRDARDWSHRNEAWVPKGIPVRIRVEKALMVRGSGPIDLEDLKPGDTVYALREDYEGKFLLVK